MPIPCVGQTATELVAQADAATAGIQNFSDTYLQPLKIFNSVVTTIAQIALGVVTSAVRYRDRKVRDIHTNMPHVLEDLNLARGELGLMHKDLRELSLEGGVGKSTITHTITLWLKDAGRFRSCFCFARDRQAERRKDKLFTTIAHDLADQGLCIPAGFG
ncbi:hypothetical protein M404DRAFT_25094 [Pisolithus tinctorius Marx 270]|uniref:Uncharacterized protein n=1 Tax=Pisolithus tinctorius Marx 270 TaxID=870435 RepID=A0A0C3K8B6_PISTI|nr:hypothetical protein M404DRAFT_25094 [Pisolithus tinctorius Marx 270]